MAAVTTPRQEQIAAALATRRRHAELIAGLAGLVPKALVDAQKKAAPEPGLWREQAVGLRSVREQLGLQLEDSRVIEDVLRGLPGVRCMGPVYAWEGPPVD
jgi:hypothetical protein